MHTAMKILIAEHAGFCEGVERAFRIAIDNIQSGKPVFMLGNLVHNKQVVERLNNFGVKTVASLSEIPKGSQGTLLISAHGVSPQIYEQAKILTLEIIDTTCPWVKKAQRIAKALADEGRTVVIVGDKGHPEIKGLVGWSYDRALVIGSEADLAKLSLPPETKVGILAQTTQAEERFAKVVVRLKSEVKDVKEYDTICDATAKRQRAALKVARQVELMLVIGDKMSANTCRLTELCAETGVETHQLETARELDLNWLRDKASVGITAGASTPEWVIREVVEKINLC